MRPYPSAIPVTAPSKRPSTTRIPSTLSSAATKCISDVPGLPKQTSTPDPTSVRKRLSAPFMLLPRSCWLSVGFMMLIHLPVRWRVALDEGAQSGDGLSDNQRVHLPGALVRVDRFRVRHEAPDVVLQQDAVSAKQLARIADGLAALDRAERLRE